MGEELFLTRRDLSSNETRYSILSFSKPRHMLAKLGYPLSRAAQSRFGADSLDAMRRATLRANVLQSLEADGAASRAPGVY